MASNQNNKQKKVVIILSGILIILVILGIFGIGQKRYVEEKEYHRYLSKEGGFSIKIPKGWIVEERVEEERFLLSAYSPTNPLISIQVLKSKNSRFRDAILMIEKRPDVTIIDRSETYIAGLIARKIIYTIGGEKEVIMIHFQKDPKYQITILCSSPISDFFRMSIKFDAIIRSFEFKE